MIYDLKPSIPAFRNDASFRDEWSLTALLQNASGERNSQIFRRYLYIFEEYSRYLTPIKS